VPATPSVVAKIEFFDVGQGDSTLVHLNENQRILIDSNIKRSLLASEPPALRALKVLEIQKGVAPDVDLLCLTHPDADHYRGLAEIVSWIFSKERSIKRYVTSVSPNTKHIRNRVENLRHQLRTDPHREMSDRRREWAELTQSHSNYVKVHRALARVITETDERGLFQIASGFKEIFGFAPARVFIVGPVSSTVNQYVEGLTDDLIRSWIRNTEHFDANESANAVSCVLWIVFPEIGVSILLTGDTTSIAWQAALDSYERNDKDSVGLELVSNIIKVPHHGSRSGSSESIWQRVLKAGGAAVVSAGGHKGYGHPHLETINHIRAAHPDNVLYCTNACGGCVVKPANITQGSFEDLSFVDAQSASGSPSLRGQTNNSGEAFHGTCTFTIFSDGTITCEPENVPRMSCDNHSRLLI
jgi:beta-lactamase superfamily II metal-dependent hydrolase